MLENYSCFIHTATTILTKWSAATSCDVADVARESCGVDEPDPLAYFFSDFISVVVMFSDQVMREPPNGPRHIAGTAASVGGVVAAAWSR